MKPEQPSSAQQSASINLTLQPRGNTTADPIPPENHLRSRPAIAGHMPRILDLSAQLGAERPAKNPAGEDQVDFTAGMRQVLDAKLPGTARPEPQHSTPQAQGIEGEVRLPDAESAQARQPKVGAVEAGPAEARTDFIHQPERGRPDGRPEKAVLAGGTVDAPKNADTKPAGTPPLAGPQSAPQAHGRVGEFRQPPAQSVEARLPNAKPVEARPSEARPIDVRLPDARPVEARLPDARMVDIRLPDARLPDSPPQVSTARSQPEAPPPETRASRPSAALDLATQGTQSADASTAPDARAKPAQPDVLAFGNPAPGGPNPGKADRPESAVAQPPATMASAATANRSVPNDNLPQNLSDTPAQASPRLEAQRAETNLPGNGHSATTPVTGGRPTPSTTLQHNASENPPALQNTEPPARTQQTTQTGGGSLIELLETLEHESHIAFESIAKQGGPQALLAQSAQGRNDAMSQYADSIRALLQSPPMQLTVGNAYNHAAVVAENARRESFDRDVGERLKRLLSAGGAGARGLSTSELASIHAEVLRRQLVDRGVLAPNEDLPEA